MSSALSNIIPYVDRTVDLSAFQGQQPQGDTLISQSLVTDVEGGELITGILKLVQRWLLEFLTIQGSMQFLPTRGCAFMQQLRSGQLVSLLDIQQAFYLSAQQVETNLESDQTSTTPIDEQFDYVTLESIAIDNEMITLYIEIFSQDGTSAPAILPINVNV
jgi:hypothetical protein